MIRNSLLEQKTKKTKKIAKDGRFYGMIEVHWFFSPNLSPQLFSRESIAKNTGPKKFIGRSETFCDAR